MGRATAYAGLVVVGLGILGLLVSLVVGSTGLMNLGSVLMNLGSVLIGLGLLTFFIGVGVHMLNR